MTTKSDLDRAIENIERRRDCAKEDMRQLFVHFEDTGRRNGLGHYNALAAMVQEHESILRDLRALKKESKG